MTLRSNTNSPNLYNLYSNWTSGQALQTDFSHNYDGQTGRSTPGFHGPQQDYYLTNFDSVWVYLAHEIFLHVREARHCTFLGAEIMRFLIAPIEDGDFNIIKRIVLFTPAHCVKFSILDNIRLYGKKSPFIRIYPDRAVFALKPEYIKARLTINIKSSCWNQKDSILPKGKNNFPLNHVKPMTWEQGIMKASNEISHLSKLALKNKNVTLNGSRTKRLKTSSLTPFSPEPFPAIRSTSTSTSTIYRPINESPALITNPNSSFFSVKRSRSNSNVSVLGPSSYESTMDNFPVPTKWPGRSMSQHFNNNYDYNHNSHHKYERSSSINNGKAAQNPKTKPKNTPNSKPNSKPKTEQNNEPEDE